MGKALTIQARRESGYVVVTVAGEVDIATVAALRERLSALAAAARLAAARGVSLHVVCAQPQTRRLFRITGLDRQIPLARDLAEALHALESGQS